MTKQRHCFVTQVGDAIEALASALDPERKPPFKGDIVDLLEWAEKDVLELYQQNTTLSHNLHTAGWGRSEEELLDEIEKLRQQLAERDAELRRINHAINDLRVDLTITAAEAITELREQVTLLRDELERIANMDDGYGEHVCCDSIIGKPHSKWCDVWKTIETTKET